jgi:hypothetical protein
MTAMRVLKLACAAGLTVSAAWVWADACMVSPTQKEEVSGRFGKFRAGGAANFGSGNAQPHMHDGLDFSTGGVAAPILATADGTVVWAKLRGSAGNTVMIRRSNGEIVAYYHLSSIAVNEGDTVTAGQRIGSAGNSGMLPGGAVHLHFIYGVPNAGDARAKSFSADAARNAVFNPAQLPNAISRKDFGYATDPSPYFCQTFPIQNDGLYPVLGADTKTQYAKVFGGAVPMGVAATQFEPVQVAAANSDALQAAAKGAKGNVASVLGAADGFGSLPSPPLGVFETLSPAEMMATEAKRRFSDAQWNTDVVKIGSRALWVDYLRAQGVSAYLSEAIRLKKERVEALLAVYTAQRLAALKGRVAQAQERAQRADVAESIK